MSELNGAINEQLMRENESLRQQNEMLSSLASVAGWGQTISRTLEQIEVDLNRIAIVLENRSRGIGSPL